MSLDSIYIQKVVVTAVIMFTKVQMNDMQQYICLYTEYTCIVAYANWIVHVYNQYIRLL